MLGRVFGNLHGGIGVAAAISYIGGGLLLDATDARTTFLVTGTAGTLATVAVALTLPRATYADRRTAGRPPVSEPHIAIDRPRIASGRGERPVCVRSLARRQGELEFTRFQRVPEQVLGETP
jgi:hypothetical protein